jgi:Family of unknown function (DUF6526)
MSAAEQNLQNHTRTDPVYHYLLLLLFALNVILCVVHFYYDRNWFSGWLVLAAFALLILVFKMRIYPLRVQDRVIRLEERLRLSLLAPADLRPRIAELSERQLIALRFASDDELPALAAKALDEHLDAKEIKKRIVHWRPDHFRV